MQYVNCIELAQVRVQGGSVALMASSLELCYHMMTQFGYVFNCPVGGFFLNIQASK